MIKKNKILLIAALSSAGVAALSFFLPIIDVSFFGMRISYNTIDILKDHEFSNKAYVYMAIVTTVVSIVMLLAHYKLNNKKLVAVAIVCSVAAMILLIFAYNKEIDSLAVGFYLFELASLASAIFGAIYYKTDESENQTATKTAQTSTDDISAANEDSASDNNSIADD